jgi:hypothetical protein
MTLTTVTPATKQSPWRTSLAPLVLDVGIPLGTYYALRDAVGLSLIMSLALSSIIPAGRTIIEFVRARKLNPLAILMIVVNVAGIATSFIVGNPRIMVAKDSVISSVIGASILISAWRGAPIMSSGLKVFLVKGSEASAGAWDRLSATSVRFRSLERRYTMIWGIALLGDCVARVVGAVLLPVSTMLWLSTVMVIVAISIAVVISGGAAAEPMERLMKAEAAA